MNKDKNIDSKRRDELLLTLKIRFENNVNRHKDLDWEKIRAKLESRPDKLWSLNEMEISGGEPDVIGYEAATQEYIFCDCSPESPQGRRSLCYDREALNSRKNAKPADSARDMAEAMGVQLASEEQYRELQNLGDFDVKTSSWIKTPPEIRELGGAVFADRRYGRVFVYHNSAESYYSARGFRGVLHV